MTRAAVLLACASLAAAISGCATAGRQPSMKGARIAPADLKPGDTAVITVEVQDRFGIVSRVEGVVKEDRTITFRLLDDGVAPDEKAEDGVWTIQVDVPFNAPPGEFEFEVVGYSDSGEVIVVRDEVGETAPLSISFGLVINYPEEDLEES